MRNSAIFKKTGTIPVWVVVRREIDGIWRTVGESERLPILINLAGEYYLSRPAVLIYQGQ